MGLIALLLSLLAPCATTAGNVYAQAQGGRAVAAARARLAASRPLAAALARHDRHAIRAALAPLSITRIEIGGVSVGHGAALAPVNGTVDGVPYTFSVAGAKGITSLLDRITGARVRLVDGPGVIAVTRFPSGAAHLTVDGGSCAPREVAERVLRGEESGRHARHVLRIVAHDPRFARAVQRDDPEAVRTQIVRFFQDPRLHVVRIRATRRGRLVNDVGGPQVLAPLSGPVRLRGRTVGRVTLSVQDIAGFEKLVHRFTGATVVLGTAGFAVPRFPTGTLRARLVTTPRSPR